jgi:hypothetical protein
MVNQSTVELHPMCLSAFSHVSIEIGHLCADEFEEGPERFCEHFRRVSHPVARACRFQAARLTDAPRISTCFLVEDSAVTAGSPADVLPDLMKAAAANGVPIDYLVRESACSDGTLAPAGVWQLLRLGLLRTPLARPQPWDGTFPDAWSRLPYVLRLNESAMPFTAYRVISVLSRRFCPNEHTVRGSLPSKALERIDYVYTD